jgi:hypothetical protein
MALRDRSARDRGSSSLMPATQVGKDPLCRNGGHDQQDGRRFGTNELGRSAEGGGDAAMRRVSA